MRSFFLASAALCLSCAFIGCDTPAEPPAKPTPPATPAPAEPGKMEPEKGKMESTTPPPVEKPPEKTEVPK